MKGRPTATSSDSGYRPAEEGIHKEAEPSDQQALSETSTFNLGRRIRIAILFWILGLSLTAAGHWVYVSLRSLDRDFSASTYRQAGAPVAWVGHGTLEEAKRRVWTRHGSPMKLPVAEKPNQPVVHALPISRFWTAISLSLVGGTFLLIWLGQFLKNNGLQSFLGALAGHALWLGGIEIGLDLASRRLGLAGSLEVHEGKLIGVHGTGILIQMSAVFLIPMLIGLTFHESNRCAVFRWVRKRLPLTRRQLVSGHVDNYAARTALQYFMTVWFCYVTVLWLADPAASMVGHILLFAALVAIAVFTPYMVWRAASQPTSAQALRYSVSGAVVTWTGIEIAAAMRLFEEPWLNESLPIGAVLAGLCIVASLMSVRVLVNPLRRKLTSAT